MIVKVSFQHLQPRDELKTYAEEKSGKLKRFFKGKINLDWHLSTQKENTIAHCHLTGKNIDYFAEDTTTDFKASIDSVVEKLEKQIQRQKEKVKDHLHS